MCWARLTQLHTSPQITSSVLAGFEGEGRSPYNTHQPASQHQANGYGAADDRTPVLGRHAAAGDPYGTADREPVQARARTPPEYGRREPVLAHEAPARGFGDGFSASANYGSRLPEEAPLARDNGARDAFSAGAGHGSRFPDQAPLARDNGARDGHSAPAAPAAGQQGTPLDGKEFFRRCSGSPLFQPSIAIRHPYISN